MRQVVLLGASYFFYGWWNWRLCFLLLAASLIAWLTGWAIQHSANNYQRKGFVALGIAALLSILGFFKYYDFFITSLQDVLFALGWERDLLFLQIVLPVGISFFTFQAISYIVDVYRNDVEAEKDPLDVLLYISFFPQLVAGPIVRASHFLPQLKSTPRLTRSMAMMGFALITVGLFKKMVVAHYLAIDLVDPVFLDPESYSSLMLLLGVYGYAIQIYCDFSGYSDIAIGTALFLGFKFQRNFHHPYAARTLQDFWRRWHISLSQWLRDYLYKPLGGSRLGEMVTYRNLMVTMLLGGLWHGAAWNFFLWGLVHGLWLAGERTLGNNKSPHERNSVGSMVQWLVTFHVVCMAWVLFRTSDMEVAYDWFTGLVLMSTDTTGLTWLTLALILIPLALQFRRSDAAQSIGQILMRLPVLVAGLIFIASVLITIAMSPSGTPPFIYFQF